MSESRTAPPAAMATQPSPKFAPQNSVTGPVVRRAGRPLSTDFASSAGFSWPKRQTYLITAVPSRTGLVSRSAPTTSLDADLGRHSWTVTSPNTAWSPHVGRVARDADGSSVVAIEGAARFVHEILRERLQVPAISSNHEHGVVFSVQKGQRRWALEIDDEGDIYIVIAGGGAPVADEEPNDLREAAESLASFSRA